ncbi:AraC-like DNA-binding protein [Deinococcus metalli]|uniref:AraC-like DNA-binding protein n=1 Tax=Deinococcus metalli TaxID=1141878 RepID=A0A7W8NQ96_9DEIO|nr:AraC family transcriptional regulator [Deinococcus metalli]MBB5374902.1 AraC-like DNA-binding protein [Deinococcus metalli]
MSAPPPVLDGLPLGRQERAVFTRPAELPGVELLSARFVTHRYLPHAHDSLAVALIEGGVEGYRYRGAQVRAAAGEVAAVLPGEVHTGEPLTPDGWAYRVLYLHPEWVVGPDGRALLGFRSDVMTDAALTAALRRAHRALLAPEAGVLARETLLRAAIDVLARHADHRARPSPGMELSAVQSVRARLDAQPELNVSLSELAAGVGLSPSHLSRSFMRSVGAPPHTYQMAARVRLARTLLDTGESVAGAATRAGFADQSHLTRVFRRVVGLTPGAYVRRR